MLTPSQRYKPNPPNPTRALQPKSPDRDEQNNDELNESIVELVNRISGAKANILLKF